MNNKSFLKDIMEVIIILLMILVFMGILVYVGSMSHVDTSSCVADVVMDNTLQDKFEEGLGVN